GRVAPRAARAVWFDRRPARAVPGLLAAHCHRRFRALAVGLSDTGVDLDRPCAALDHRAVGDGDLDELGPRQSLGWPCRLLSEQDQPEAAGGDRYGAAPRALLHRRLRAAGDVRLFVAPAAHPGLLPPHPPPRPA